MSKKAILSTLLISSALLGTTVAANAATSGIKAESKLVTVEKSNAKIYKNSKLQESKKAKKGTVYKVDGYRNINSKKYYRVYQEDTKGKVVYKGYILDKDTKVLKGQKPAKKDRFVGVTKADQTAWKSLYFNKKIKTYDGTKHASNFEVKHTYKIGDKKYYSLYRGEKWMGYMDASGFKVLTPKHLPEDKRHYEVEKDYETYNDIYFTEKGQLKVGEKVEVKNIYTFGNGRHYGSLYNQEGKWIGYANMHALKEIETSTPDEPSKPENPDTKPEQSELEKAKQAAEEAIKKAEAALATSNASKESKEAAQKVIDAAKETVKGNDLDAIKKIPAQLDEAIKALQPADVKALEDAIKRAEDLVKTPGLTGTDKVQEKLDAAKKVLEEAKKGTASKEDIKKATDELNKAIADVKLDTTNLKDALEATKQLAKDYYLTKDQEAKLNKVFDEVQKVVNNAKTDSKSDIDAAKAKLDKIANDLKAQPTYSQGQALSDAIAKANKLKAHADIAKVLFEDFNGVKSAYDEASNTMTELKKDAQFGENTATKELTAKDVEAVAQKLNDALNNLKINAENTKTFYDEAKKAIEKLDEADKATPNEALKAFEDAAKKGTAKDINEILDTAKDLVNAIDAAQTKELKEAIDKAEKIISDNDKYKAGNETEVGEDFYTKETFDKLKDELKKAQEAIQLTPATTTKATAHKKADAKTALDDAINKLQINHWDSEVKDGKVYLTDYKPLNIKDKNNLELPSLSNKNGVEIAFRKDKIVIPGKLKDMPVVLDIKDQEDKSGASIIKNNDLEKLSGNHGMGVTLDGKEYYVAPDKVSVTFKAVDNQKVTTGDTLYRTFYILGSVDVTGLDTSNVKTFNETFGKYVGTTITGIEGLNTQNAESFLSMFSGANKLTSLDLSKWTMDKATNLNSMFFQTTNLTDLNLSGWELPQISVDKVQKKVFGDKRTYEGPYPLEDTFCGVIHINSKAHEGKDRVWVEGLQYPTNEHAKQVIQEALDQSITGTTNHTKPKAPSKDQKEEATSNTEVQK